ncbi:hypothetical protein LguiA_021953 [Lonicera macranthoides]
MGEDRDSEEDRISHLPDEILTYIPSFLPLKEAVVISVLSRRRMDQWAFATCHFDHKISRLDDNHITMKERSAGERRIMAKKLKAMNTDWFVR